MSLLPHLRDKKAYARMLTARGFKTGIPNVVRTEAPLTIYG